MSVATTLQVGKRHKPPLRDVISTQNSGSYSFKIFFTFTFAFSVIINAGVLWVWSKSICVPFICLLFYPICYFIQWRGTSYWKNFRCDVISNSPNSLVPLYCLDLPFLPFIATITSFLMTVVTTVPKYTPHTPSILCLSYAHCPGNTCLHRTLHIFVFLT